MNSSVKKIKNKGPSMIPALSPNGLAGIVPDSGIKNENFNGCFSIHHVISPIVYFDIKKEGLFPSKKSSSNIDRLARLCPACQLHPEIPYIHCSYGNCENSVIIT